MSSSVTRSFQGVRSRRESRASDVQSPTLSPIRGGESSTQSRSAGNLVKATTNICTSPLLSDEALMALICRGDKDALALLFRRFARVVRGVAIRVLRDASEADDLVQDIFLLIHRKCATFDGSRGPARFWILLMTYHRAIARRRYLNSRHFYTRVDLEDMGRELSSPGTDRSGFLDSGYGLPGREVLQRVFERLSENQRQTLQLFFVDGYTLSEIAMKLNQTRGNVKNHYFRGLEKLRKEIFGSKLAGDSTG
jgi:RNA polymerase sigma-70 factor (ECF subfamily)